MGEAQRFGYTICTMGDGIAIGDGGYAGNWQRTVECFSINDKEWERLPDIGRVRACLGADKDNMVPSKRGKHSCGRTIPVDYSTCVHVTMEFMLYR